ncbi:MAG: glycerol-3-phosphate dehydrogenase subunit GlpB [Clostridiales bacterium]|nr:glycerol-3-phosphate dehydrogenase subunit GlpB [Clostridiales bacterium]
MLFDSIIIGGGLAALTAAISLAEAGQRTAVIAAGQSTLHFSSGAFGLLGFSNGKTVTNPVKAMESLDSRHPYSRIGIDRLLKLLPMVQPMLTRAGIATTGNHYANRFHISPLGNINPVWLALDDLATFDSATRLPWRSVAIVNIATFQDFYPLFLASALEKRGVRCSIHSTSIPAIDNLRRSSSEMRAPTMARVLDYDNIGVLAGRLNSVSRNADAIIMPAILGLNDDLTVRLLRRLVAKPVYFISTMPTSVPGVRTQMLLNRYFQKLGGTFMLGDSVTHGDFDGSRLSRIFTANHGPEPLVADNYILATGSFVSRGLRATPSSIIEPTLNLDVDFPTDRALWYDKDMDNPQPYMEFGVITDKNWHPCRSGTYIENLQCVGSIVGGCNPIKQGCGAGVAILSAFDATTPFN